MSCRRSLPSPAGRLPVTSICWRRTICQRGRSLDRQHEPVKAQRGTQRLKTNRLPDRGREAVWFDARVVGSGRGGEVAELLQVLFLLLVARRQLEQARRGAAEDVVLRLLGQEGLIVDRCRQIEVPVRIVRRVEQLRLR